MKSTIQQSRLNWDDQEVIGLVLQQVAYTEVDYYPARPQPCYTTDHPQIHTVDFSIRLSFSNNKSLAVSWKNFEIREDGEYSVYGLDADLDTGEPVHLAGQRTWIVSAENIWQELIGQPVRNVKTYWSKTRVETAGEEKELDHFYLEALALTFENNKSIFISIAEFQAGNLHKVVKGANNLLVTTDESLARKTNMVSAEAQVT